MECFHHIKVVCSSSLRCLQVRQAALLPGYSIMLRSTIVSASAVGLNATHCLKTTFSLALTLDFTLYSKNCRKSSMLFFDISTDTADRHYVIEQVLYHNLTFVPLNLSLLYQLIRSTMTTKKWNLKVNNHPVFEFLVIEQILLQFFSEIRYSILKLVEVHLPKRRRKPKLSFVLVCSETNL